MKMSTMKSPGGCQLPLVVEPIARLSETRTLMVLRRWIENNRATIEDRLLQHGAILFRGFLLSEVADFDAAVRVLAPSLLSYAGGDSPRDRVADRIYTSTSHPPEESISLHNELSYMRDPPAKFFAFCRTPPDEGGETPIADCRRVYDVMDRTIRERFEKRGVTYFQCLHGGEGLGKSWQETFETAERSVVEEFLQSADIEFEWQSNGDLHTISRRPAVISHPRTGDVVWFNQADAWHLDQDTRQALLGVMSEAAFPHNARHGDGEPIDPSDIEEIRQTFWREAVIFPWQRGDLLVCDNILVAHGRRPFSGRREILVAMA